MNNYADKPYLIAQIEQNIRDCLEVYSNLKTTNFTENELRNVDFTFVSEDQSDLDDLYFRLEKNKIYRLARVNSDNGKFYLEGETNTFPFNLDNFILITNELVIKGLEFNCEFSSFGTMEPNEKIINKPHISQLNKYLQDAQRNFELGNFAFTIFSLNNYIDLEKKNPGAFSLRAYCKQMLENNKGAIEDYNIALKFDPDDLDLLTNIASSKNAIGDFNGAIKDYDKALKKYPDLADLYLNRGNSKHNKKDKRGAIKDWQKAKQLGSKESDILLANVSE